MPGTWFCEKEKTIPVMPSRRHSWGRGTESSGLLSSSGPAFKGRRTPCSPSSMVFPRVSSSLTGGPYLRPSVLSSVPITPSQTFPCLTEVTLPAAEVVQDLFLYPQAETGTRFAEWMKWRLLLYRTSLFFRATIDRQGWFLPQKQIETP